ncbi:MAG: UDP-N-acetylmuramoyl-tripeptide--D-alanyl-D-alanine ligase [Micrococcales bacterium]|nr:UDP-N-acetylmuramoyl-tripeptide--D-alanyl-D-alanine ligase [Micrococcales bacterium]
MIPLTLADVVAATGGRLHGIDAPAAAGLVVDGPVVTDSREARPGGLYVARVGEHADGHRYAGAARDAGAVAALTSRAVEELPCVVVDDVQLAFGQVARAVVDRAPALTVIGITGSSGKTSTKDLLAAVLGEAGPTVAPVNSLNGEIGVPLTVCRVAPETRFLVAEMGARGIGHIDYLTRIAPPRVGIVLNVGTAHMGEFGSREAIGRAKSELVAALPADGLAVLNADDPVVAGMRSATSARVVTVGLSEGADYRAVDVALDHASRPSFTLEGPDGEAEIALPLHGEHHIGNALAVIAAARECGMPLEQITAALAVAEPASRWRMEVTERADGVTVVNDAYNANPDSMGAALRALVGMTPGAAADGSAGRRVAVLGSMLELGEESDSEHAGVGALAAEAGVDELVVVGELARPIAHGAAEAGLDADRLVTAPDADAAEAHLRDTLRPGDIVLLKSSRDAGLRWLGDRLAGQMEVPS